MHQDAGIDSPPISALERFVQQARKATETAQARCDLCGAPLPPEHRHMLEIASGQALCACHACSILFDREAASEGRYRLISNRRLYLQSAGLDDTEWEGLRIPMGLAFLFYSTRVARMVALYPGPMGTIESTVEPAMWDGLVERNPVFGTMAPDVEAFLVNRIGHSREHFVVPIDECFKLVALIRSHWKGLAGGQEVWRQVEQFFESLRQRSSVVAVSTIQIGGNV